MIIETAYQNPLDIYQRLRGSVKTDLLASTANNKTARYSFIGIDPFQTIILDDSFEPINTLLTKYHCEHEVKGIPFQGGAIGFISYEFAAKLENIPLAKNEFSYPNLAFSFYDLIIAFDHNQKQSFIISRGAPEITVQKKMLRAEKRAQWLKKIIAKSKSSKEKALDNKFKITSSLSKKAVLKLR